MTITIPELNLSFKCWKIKHIKNYLLNKEESTPEVEVDNIFKYLFPKIDISEFTLDDKLYFLLKARSIVIGETISNLEYTCSCCKRPTEGYYNINESLEYNKSRRVQIIDGNEFEFNGSKSALDSIRRINNILEKKEILEFIDNMTFTQSSKLFSFINTNINNITSFSFNPKVHCVLCNGITEFSSEIDTIINLIIDMSLINIYKLEVELKLKGNFSIKETLNMHAFEKEIYIESIKNIRGED